MSFARLSLRGLLRDTTKVLLGTVLGILLTRTLMVPNSGCSVDPVLLHKRDILGYTPSSSNSEGSYAPPNNKVADVRHSVNTTSAETASRPTPSTQTTTSKTTKEKPPTATKIDVKAANRPKSLNDEVGSSMRHPLFIGVVTAQALLPTRAKAVNQTWGTKAAKLKFFSSQDKTNYNLPVVSLPGVDDTYPPQKKVFRMLKYMHDNYIDEYNWFMRADDDIYIRVHKLTEFLSQLDPSREFYIGQPGMGKPEDLGRIKLQSYERYCMGGPGVVFSRALLKKLAPHLEDCLKTEVVSWNEDLEVGRCISHRLGIQCTWNYEVGLLYESAYRFRQVCSIRHSKNTMLNQCMECH